MISGLRVRAPRNFSLLQTKSNEKREKLGIRIHGRWYKWSHNGPLSPTPIVGGSFVQGPSFVFRIQGILLLLLSLRFGNRDECRLMRASYLTVIRSYLFEPSSLAVQILELSACRERPKIWAQGCVISPRGQRPPAWGFTQLRDNGITKLCTYLC